MGNTALRSLTRRTRGSRPNHIASALTHPGAAHRAKRHSDRAASEWASAGQARSTTWILSRRRRAKQGPEDGERMSAQVEPSHILQVGMGFWGSKTLLSAVELELFTRLGSESMTGPEIAEALGLDAR